MLDEGWDQAVVDRRRLRTSGCVQLPPCRRAEMVAAGRAGGCAGRDTLDWGKARSAADVMLMRRVCDKGMKIRSNVPRQRGLCLMFRGGGE